MTDLLPVVARDGATFASLTRALLTLALLAAVRAACAKTVPGEEKTDGPPPIQDNSFLLEKAYNQEEGMELRERPPDRAGIAVPIGLGPSRHDRRVFLYLSFEHPMWKGSSK